jgi:hypothetical protein
VILQTADPPKLSVAERLAAVNAGFRHVDDSAGAVWRMIGIAAALLLIAAFVAWLVGRARTLRWIAHHLRTLASGGLHEEELVLFRALARRVDPTRVPLLTRQVAAFDSGAAAVVRRALPAERRELLARVLALRRRMPFGASGEGMLELTRGTTLLVCVRLGRGEPLRLPARIDAALPHSLQVVLDDLPEAREVAPLLRPGQDVVLVARRGVVLEEAHVRIRGLGEGTPTMLLVDRPVGFSAARVRIVWQGADETIHVEFSERFSKSYIADDAPSGEARIVATCSEGLMIQFQATRPRRGETIRILDGARAGTYRGYATTEPKGNGGDVFVIRRSGEREPIVEPLATKEREHEPAIRA